MCKRPQSIAVTVPLRFVRPRPYDADVVSGIPKPIIRRNGGKSKSPFPIAIPSRHSMAGLLVHKCLDFRRRLINRFGDIFFHIGNSRIERLAVGFRLLNLAFQRRHVVVQIAHFAEQSQAGQDQQMAVADSTSGMRARTAAARPVITCVRPGPQVTVARPGLPVTRA